MTAKTMAGEANISRNMSDVDNERSLQRSCILYLFVIDTIVTGTIIVGGVIGNSLAFVVFWKDNLKTSASFLFQSLALVDSAYLLLSIPVFPVPSFVAYTNWMKGYEDIVAYVYVYILPLVNVVQTASIWVVVLLSINRYIAVCFPFKALRWCTISKVKKQLAFVLLSAVLYNIPKCAESRIKYVTYDNGTTYKPCSFDTNLGKAKLYDIIYDSVLYFTFLVALPIFTLTYVNIRLIQALKARRRKRSEMVSQLQQNDNNVTVVLIIVIVVFIICQIPAFVGYALLNMTSDNAKFCGGYDFYLRPVANMLLVLNSAVNFDIYVVFNKRFRQVLTQTVGCCSVLEVDGHRSRSTERPPRVMDVSCVRVRQENNNECNVEETRL